MRKFRKRFVRGGQKGEGAFTLKGVSESGRFYGGDKRLEIARSSSGVDDVSLSREDENAAIGCESLRH